MSIRNTDTKVYLYLNDYNAVCGEIYRHQRIETGGNLFGLWTTEGNVVVHVPLGPGENCKRTDVSFHQEIAYLSRVGSFLNKKFMLCHIGEWHSHHRLTLNEPSSGDKRTVRDNYPNGVKKFLVIIGNIIGSDQISLSPYFFSKNGNTCEKGILKVLDTDSPFTTDETIIKEMNEGAESPRHPMQNSSTPTDPSGTNDHSLTDPQNSVSHSPSSVSHSNAFKSGSDSVPADKNPTTSSSVLIPPRDYKGSSILLATPKSPTEPHPSASCSNPSIANSSSANEAKDDGGNKQTRKEAIMKKVFEEIKSKFDHSDIVMKGEMSGVIEMKFKHNGMYWLIKFLRSFPEKPAEIFYSYSDTFFNTVQSDYSKREFLNNHIDILLTIKKECNFSVSYCASCRKLSIENLAQSEPSVDLFLSKEGNDMIKELCDKAKDTAADPGSLKKKMKCDDMLKNAILEVSFTHSSIQWIIDVCSTFPAESRPAELYCKNEGQWRSPSRVYYGSGRGPSKDWVSEVLFAIAKRCNCVNCRKFEV